MRRVLLLALLASFALPAAAQRCDTALADADEQYRAGYFDDVIERLSDCLDRNAFSSEERRRAYRLLGLSYIGKDREEEARAAVRSLLEIAPDYQPDPAIDPPPFVDLVREMNRPIPPPADPITAQAPQPVSRTKGFMGSLSAIGTGYSDEGTDLSGGGADLVLGYGVTPQVAVVLRLGGAALSGSNLVGSFTSGIATLGGRYHIGGGQRAFVPYLGGGAAFQTISYMEGGLSVDFNGPGGEIEGGILYFFNPSLALSGGISLLFASLSNDADPESFSATTVNVGAGISWSPGQ